jgi:hypothetical protein
VCGILQTIQTYLVTGEKAGVKDDPQLSGLVQFTKERNSKEIWEWVEMQLGEASGDAQQVGGHRTARSSGKGSRLQM